ncbi:MAG: DNA replication and repair protein RecF [Gammaproteobacteria bacterium]|nr:DNA replication and repair protein RecF [Gammaproteobacteria bacterium]
MNLDRLEVDHFRILEQVELDLQPGISLFTGPNGAGKTSLLETTHLLARGKSFRRGSVESQIHHAADTLTVRGRFSHQLGTMRVDFAKRRSEPLELQRDRRRVERVSDMVLAVPLQTFLPDLAELVLGPPQQRRRWLDIALLYADPTALQTMAHYRHVLRQRNAALRLRQLAQLDAWDVEMSASATAVTAVRMQCFAAMAEHVKACVLELCPELEISMSIYSGYGEGEFAVELAQQRARDVKLSMTHTGPHRADIRIRIGVSNSLRSGTTAVATRLSQGQARALAAAFKLGQVRYLKSLGFESLLLVDDLGSEWDGAHCDRFLALVRELGSQALCSAVDEAALPAKWHRRWARFRLAQGRLVNP